MKCLVSDIFKKSFSYKKEVILGNIVAFSSTLILIFIPLLIPLLIDELLLKKDQGIVDFIETYFFSGTTEEYLFFILFAILFARLISVILGIWQSKIFTIISKDISFKLRFSLLTHLKTISLKEYERMHTGAITSKLVTDIETVDNFVSNTISKFLLSSLTLILTSIILIYIHWQLALFILITNPIVLFFTAKFSRSVGKLKREQNKSVESFQSSLNETLELFYQIRASNKDDYFFNQNQKEAQKLKHHSIEFSYKNDRASRFSFYLFLSGYELFRVVTILAVANSSLSIGLMLAIFSYLWVMVTPTQDVINFQYALSSAKNACERINEIFQMEQEEKKEASKNPFIKEEATSIETKNLYFSYLKEKTILKNINLEIKRGSKIAFVGASGSGKTTLAHILVGFYPIDSGEIFYNGISNKNITQSTIRENIYLILQHPKLFNDTMLFNLTLGKTYHKEEIEKALEIAQLNEVIKNMPNGIDSLVGKEGVTLSGGQRQRVSIARMILTNPKVVIFDESTSALDIHTEAKLFKALKEFLEPKTVITIAHRLSTIENAEYIYVFEDGKVVDSGTPKSLLEKDKSYFSLMI